jgi:hypothetical protein
MPLGFRTPFGRIQKEGIENLSSLGIKFDSSVFPSFWPYPFKYINIGPEPYYIYDSDVLEIPISVMKPIRLPFAISYIKLFGFPVYNYFIKKFSQDKIIVFDSHLHDFIPIKNTEILPFHWRNIYKRNKFKGNELFKKFLQSISDKEYKSIKMSDLYEIYSKK